MLLEEGKCYHLYNRGNNREILFKEPRNYPYFLNLWKKHVDPIAETWAYNLLPNHFHFAVRIREHTGRQPLQFSRALANMFGAYAKAINKSFGRTGSLFEKNFHRKEVSSSLYLERLIPYIHTNAQKHLLVQDFRQYPHSSYAAMLSNKPTRLQRAALLKYYGGLEAFCKAHETFLMRGEDLQQLFLDPSDDDGYHDLPGFLPGR